MNKYHEDEQRLVRIKEGDRLYLKSVYLEYSNVFISFIKQHYECSEEDAKSVYSDSFTRFYFNIKDGVLNPPLKSKLSTYLISIGIKVFHQQFLNTYYKRTSFPEEMKEGIEAAEILNHYELEAQVQIVKKILPQLKASCQKLIQLMFFQNYKAAEVAEEMNFNSSGTVRKHKSDCLKKMRALLGQ